MLYTIRIKPHNRSCVSSSMSIPEDSQELCILLPGMQSEDGDNIYDILSQELNSNKIATMQIDILGLSNTCEDQNETINSYYMLSSDLKALVRVMKNVTTEDIYNNAELSLEKEYVTNIPMFKTVKLVCMDLMSRCAVQGSFIKDENVETILINPLLKDGNTQFESLCGKRGIYEKIATRYKSCPVELDTKNGKVTKMVGVNFYSELAESKPLEQLDQISQNLIHIYCTDKESQEPEIKFLSSQKTIIQENEKGEMSIKMLIPELVKNIIYAPVVNKKTLDMSQQKEPERHTSLSEHNRSTKEKTVKNILRENEILSVLYNEHSETEQIQQEYAPHR